MSDILSLTFILPFLFTFAVIFGVLEITKVFPNKGVLAVISLVFAYFASTNQMFLTLFNQNFMYLTGFFIAMFLLIFVLEIFGLRPGKSKNPTDIMKEFAIHAFILFILLTVGFYGIETLDIDLGFISNSDLALLIGFVVIIALFWAVFRLSPIFSEYSRAEAAAREKSK